MEVDQVPSTRRVWSYGEETGQDITITLRPSENTNKLEAELKMHSSVLKQFSRYFEVALKERWNNASSSGSSSGSSSPALMTLSLEMMSAVPVECYIECFERMYQPLTKAFHNVEASLHLLRAASHIDYEKLTMDICGYLSAKRWSKDEEMLIREYASSEDFPSSQAKDLMVRLSLDGSTRTNNQKKLDDVVEESIHISLGRGRDNPPMMSMADARSFIVALFAGIGESVKNPEFYKDMMSIINNATKELLVEFEEHCRQHGLGKVVATEPHMVPRFGDGLEAICWILDKLMEANVAEEAVGWFLQLELYPKLFEAAVFSSDYAHISCSVDIVRLVLLMHEKAASGDLVLKESARVKLFQDWDLIKAYRNLSHFYGVLCDLRDDKMLSLRATKRVELVLQAKEDVYHTLSLGKQIELVEQGVCCRPQSYIEPRSLARLVKRKWAP